MKRRRRKQTAAGIAVLFCLLFLMSCGRQDKNGEEQNDTGFVAADKGIFDSADTAVVAQIDMDEKNITLKNMEKKIFI